MDKKILFILTGGTIDSKTKGLERDVLLKHSGISAYLRNLEPHQNMEFVEAVWKDSRDVTDNDREKILKIIEKSDAEKIIVTHGTFTMAETGKFLKSKITKKDKVIILTGAMSPLLFKDSDAPSNLKFSLENAENLSSGVYVCMNGRVLDPDEAAKDIKKEQFYSIYDN
jgi:L-asparaginase